jgi:hypothetical protein
MAVMPGDLRRALLHLAAQQRPRADTAEEGLAICAQHVDATPADIAAEIAALVAASLLRDPVRLPPGQLQCHWLLEPTAAGYAAAAGAP